MANTNKKARERDVLEAALKLARKRGGECRRLADRLDGPVVDRTMDECPDIVLRCRNRSDNACIVGVEHFRVDQLTEVNDKTGKRMSATSRVRARFNRLQEDYKNSGAREPNDQQIEQFAEVTEELLLAQGILQL